MSAPTIMSASRRTGRLIALLGTLALMAVACGESPSPDAAVTAPGAEQAATYGRPELLANADWLEENLGRDDLVILDVRSAAMYAAGHIPGAVNLSPLALNDDGPVRGMVAPPERVESVLEGLVVSDDSRVVVYDDDRGMWAARVFWILDYYGKSGVSLLNGGFARWRDEDRPVDASTPEKPAGILSLGPNVDRVASKDYVQAALDRRGVVLLDARTPREYSGDTALSARGGRIPGAVNVPWEDALTVGEVVVFKTPDGLSTLFRRAGVSPDKEIIVYCQTGVRAAHAYFTLRLMGYENVRLYDGSWEEWGNDPSLPLEGG